MPSPRQIHVHFHTIPVFYQEAVIAAGLGPTRRSGYPPCSPEAALEMMDVNGIEFAIASVSMPGVQFCEPEKAKALARRLNEHAAEQRARWPSRFGGFAIIPMRNPNHAIAEIAYALDVLKLEGVCLFTNYDGIYLGDPAFDPILEALNAHGAVVYTHPTIHPSSRTIPLKYPGFLMEYPFDTTRMAVNLILTGALNRSPGSSLSSPMGAVRCPRCAGGSHRVRAWMRACRNGRARSTPSILPASGTTMRSPAIRRRRTRSRASRAPTSFCSAPIGRSSTRA